MNLLMIIDQIPGPHTRGPVQHAFNVKAYSTGVERTGAGAGAGQGHNGRAASKTSQVLFGDDAGVAAFLTRVCNGATIQSITIKTLDANNTVVEEWKFENVVIVDYGVDKSVDAAGNVETTRSMAFEYAIVRAGSMTNNALQLYGWNFILNQAAA